ncbi:hypothetical protein BC332_21964 [Capsicum chinense]|nr:hypothetical protein BC332_21964 [Capsicum chinense]
MIWCLIFSHTLGYGNKAEVRSSNEHPNTMQARCDSYYDKWWIPAPKVPPNDLSYSMRKWLRLQKDSVNQVHKAVIAINSQVLSEMEIPESYIESLPRMGEQAEEIRSTKAPPENTLIQITSSQLWTCRQNINF